MTDAAIATLKNHLPELVRKAEQGEDIQITRHGKPVAVMVSLEKYKRLVSASPNLANVFQQWRERHPHTAGFTQDEEDAIYKRTREPFAETGNAWD